MAAGLRAYDAAGQQGCSGTTAPRTCAPLWRALLPPGAHSLVAVNGRVYAAAQNRLATYDGHGVDHCSGTPKFCTPLWTATVTGALGELTAANGVIYAVAFDNSTGPLLQKLVAFDAKGTNNCSGSPKVCAPLWTAPVGSPTGFLADAPAVANGVVYVGVDGNVDAFDAAGVQGCSGGPKTCSPLRVYVSGSTNRVFSTAIANGRLYVGVSPGPYVFDADGGSGCSGTPVTCAPLWRVTPDTSPSTQEFVSVGRGVLYARRGDGKVRAYDADGTTGCSGQPKTCAALWQYGGNPAGSAGFVAIANGVVYASVNQVFCDGSCGSTIEVDAFDAAGHQSCSGSPPTCNPLVMLQRTGQQGTAYTDPVVADGTVFVADDTRANFSGPTSLLHAFATS